MKKSYNKLKMNFDDLFISDHSRAFETQRYEHVYRMLKLRRKADLTSTHEPEEIKSAMRLYEKILQQQAKMIVNRSLLDTKVQKFLKLKQDKDLVLRTKQRVFWCDKSIFSTRVFMYVFIVCVIGFICLITLV